MRKVLYNRWGHWGHWGQRGQRVTCVLGKSRRSRDATKIASRLRVQVVICGNPRQAGARDFKLLPFLFLTDIPREALSPDMP
jgi:hypothetical protein